LVFFIVLFQCDKSKRGKSKEEGAVVSVCSTVRKERSKKKRKRGENDKERLYLFFALDKVPLFE